MALTEVDRSLLARCLEHHPGAWRDFVDRFIGLFVHVVNHTAHARSVRLSSDDIDDLCAEVFLTLLADDFAVLRRFRGRCSLATYLAVIARRVVVREIARRRKAEALGHVPAHKASLDRAGSGPVHERRIDDEDEIQAMLAGLGERDASVVRHFHLEGRSYSEISQLMGIPENSIGPTLARARGRLRQQNVRS
ncbi:MAG: RNA polymerase subunit sigma-70 [Planctomycetaceae bacterium]|nr:RNA polymerase subunit sigma-70 [Planctomycetaceae bacterium]